MHPQRFFARAKMNYKDILITASIILIPSWTVAYITDKIIYVVPMLAVTTFIVAQVIQHRNHRRLDEDGMKMKDIKDGMRDEGQDG